MYSQVNSWVFLNIYNFERKNKDLLLLLLLLLKEKEIISMNVNGLETNLIMQELIVELKQGEEQFERQGRGHRGDKGRRRCRNMSLMSN